MKENFLTKIIFKKFTFRGGGGGARANWEKVQNFFFFFFLDPSLIWQVEAEQRWSAEELLNHPFLRMAEEKAEIIPYIEKTKEQKLLAEDDF